MLLYRLVAFFLIGKQTLVLSVFVYGDASGHCLLGRESHSLLVFMLMCDSV